MPGSLTCAYSCWLWRCVVIAYLCDGDVVYRSPKAPTCCHLFLVLWVNQSDKFLYAVDFTKTSQGTSTAGQGSWLLWVLVCYLPLDWCGIDAASGISKALDNCYLFLGWMDLHYGCSWRNNLIYFSSWKTWMIILIAFLFIIGIWMPSLYSTQNQTDERFLAWLSG